MQADIRDRAQVDRLIKMAGEEFGKIDVSSFTIAVSYKLLLGIRILENTLSQGSWITQFPFATFDLVKKITTEHIKKCRFLQITGMTCSRQSYQCRAAYCPL